MEQKLRQREAQDRDRRRARELNRFSLHLLAFVVVGAGLCFVDFLEEGDASPRIDWALWVLLFWGSGLLMHTLATYAGVVGRDWERRKLEQLPPPRVDGSGPRGNSDPGLEE